MDSIAILKYFDKLLSIEARRKIMNKNTTVAIAIALVAILIGGSVALIVMSKNRGSSVRPIDYVAENCMFFAQFDSHIDGGELVDQINPMVAIYRSMMDEATSEFLDFDYSFIELSGFIAINSDNIIGPILGIRLSGKGNPKSDLNKLLDMIKQSTEIEITHDEDGYITIGDEIKLYVDENYILISTSASTIESSIDVKNGISKSIKTHDDWNDISKMMTSTDFSFFAQLPSNRESTTLTGTYFEKSENEVGLELTLIGGIERLNNSYDIDETEIFTLLGSLFENATDLSEIISELPDSSIRGAISTIPNINQSYMDETGFSFDGLLGFWFEGLNIDSLDDTGMLAQPKNMTLSQLTQKLFPEDRYWFKDVSGGKAIYKELSEWEKEYMAPNPAPPTPEYFIKDDPEKLIILSKESMLDDNWVFSPIDSMRSSVLYCLIDFSLLVEQIADLEEIRESGAAIGIPMLEEMLKQANIKMIIHGFESKPHIKLQLTLTGDFSKLNSFMELLTP
jgi:hypothetical protein